MVMVIPSLVTTTLTTPRHRIYQEPYVPGADAILESANIDAGSTPTSLIRPGNVVALRTATGQYVEATDANGDRCTAPSIVTSGHGDGNGVIRVVGNHGSISVTTATGAGTEANNATDLNANAAFAAHYVASSAAGELTIAARGVGADEWFYVHADTMATAAFGEGEANGARGVDADYRVTEGFASLLDSAGAAAAQPVETSMVGYYDTSELISSTPEALAVLTRRGSLFG